jgi:acyl transferase domain-containing protein/NADP-dependent 3-hydroxy acid dehydrogenase YdfG/acyl carrier protein
MNRDSFAAKRDARDGAKVAIVGVACRFPGESNTPEAFFASLLNGSRCVGPIPGDRWAIDKFLNEHDAAGKTYASHGHFIKNYDYRTLDADFFRFSPREAEFLDPQQRLLLEVSWEALESAGLDIESLAGSQTGVFVGGFTLDHLLNQLGAGARDSIGSHSAAGATLTMLSNRVSYAFDFRGPSLSLDTACSSSLVAFAQAVTSISTGQCEVALVGGVNFMLRPEYAIAMAKGRFLAKDGRSKSFDARADGYGRGEGCGVVVLKHYEAAIRDHDDILAVVDGTGVNQDGRTSGITVPNAEAQRALMEKVLAQSGLGAEDIDYIEAHGTGTPVGDPIETRAIAAVYGGSEGCLVGSVKANIGHLEAAAGVASIIKAVMMLRHGMIPPVAGLDQVNPDIPSTVRLPRAPQPLGRGDGPRRVAINSFGYGGTNAHVILSSDTKESQRSKPASPEREIKVVPLSARDSQALRVRAGQISELLESRNKTELDDVVYTTGLRRTHLSHRVAVWGANAEDLAAALRRFAAGDADFCGAEGARPAPGNARIAFVYTGMGPQWWGMGRALLRDNQVFRETLEHADSIIMRIGGFSILEELRRDEADSRIKRTEFAQPANLMIQMGLTEALRAEGIVADAVVGHSVGEIASGWASGMLSLEDALRVSIERSRIQATTAGRGGMLALGVSADEAADAIRPHHGKVSIAAINSPRSVTIAGDRGALAGIRRVAEARNLFARPLDVEVPYHSPMMEPLKPQLRAALGGLSPVRPVTALYSTVTGALVGESGGDRLYDAEYWCDNVRNPVHFADAIAAMLADGYGLFVEVGPHPVLRRSLEEISAAGGAEVSLVSTLRMNQPETPALYRAVCEIYVHGGAVDWAGRAPHGAQMQLPSYPWQRQLLWREAPGQMRDRLDAQRAPLSAPGGDVDLNLRRLNYLYEHVVDGSPIMPAAGYLETLCEEAARHWPKHDGLCVRDVRIHQALVLDHERSLRLETQFDPTTHRVQLHSRDADDLGTRKLHAEATVHPYHGRPAAAVIDAPCAESAENVDTATFYSELHALALQYGPAFQPVRTLRRDLARGVAEAELTRQAGAGEDTQAYILHPVLLDGCFQTALSLMPPSEGAYLPVSLKALEVYAPLPESIACRTRIVERSEARLVCDFELRDVSGNLIARIDGLLCQSLRGRSKATGFPAGDYQRVWRPIAPRTARRSSISRLLLVGDRADALADALMAECEEQRVSFDRCTWEEVATFDRLAKISHVVGLSWAACDARSHSTGEDEIGDMLDAVKALAAQARPLPLRVITRNAHPVLATDRVTPAQAAVAAFMRVVRNEFAALDAATIDVAASLDADTAQRILAESLAEGVIDEIALRDGACHGAVMIQSAVLQEPQHVQANTASTSLSVALVRQSSAFSATILPARTLPDAAYELRVERFGLQVEHDAGAAGVVGIITRAGAATSRFAVGDRVAGLVPHSVANVLFVDETQCVLEVVAERGATSALLATIEARAAAIVRACSLGTGRRALIAHGAFGDALSRRLVATGVAVSRAGADLSWQQTPHDPGFDLIAAPLAEWSHQVGFFALAKGGQLVDLDDTPSPFALPAHCNRLFSMRNDLSDLKQSSDYRAALRAVLAERSIVPDATKKMGFADLLRAGQGSEIAFADDWIELQLSDDTRPFDAAAADLPALRRDGTYLLTGGFSGLGREVARWLARNGAGRVALAGRRGLDTPGAARLLEELRELGAEATAHAIDTSSAQQVRSLVARLHRLDAPLVGIYHAAGVLEDRLLNDMSRADIQRVMRPKAGGAWALHEAAAEVAAPLEHFVLFSSIASLVGNSRQANYCAANGFLDGLVHLRRSQGLPALGVNFGAIDSVGMLGHDVRVGQHLTQIGLTPIGVSVALQGIGRALAKRVTQVAISERIVWEKWAAYESVGGASPAFADLVAASRAEHAGNASLVEQLHAALSELDDDEASGILKALIAEVIASALKTSVERLGYDQPFDSFGVDSLMSTDIQIQLDQKLGVSYSVIELLGSATIAQLANRALPEIRASNAAERRCA